MAFVGSAAAWGGGGEMDGYFSAKRKDPEGEYDDEFLLSSPARKIRRLDLEFTPIMEEEDPAAPPPVLGGQQPLLPQEKVTSSCSRALPSAAGPALSMNEERALVLYKPVNGHVPPESSKVVYSVDADMIATLKNQTLWPGQQSQRKKVVEEEEEETAMDTSQVAANNCLAVVPWLPSHLPEAGSNGTRVSATEEMESEEVEGSSMDVDEGGAPNRGGPLFAGIGASDEGLQQQWQQHCMIPQPPPQNTATPIMWSWG